MKRRPGGGGRSGGGRGPRPGPRAGHPHRGDRPRGDRPRDGQPPRHRDASRDASRAPSREARDASRAPSRDASRGAPRDRETPRELDTSPYFDGIPPPFEVIFGMNPVREALLAGRRKFRRMFVARREETPEMAELLELAQSKGLRAMHVERDALEAIVAHSASGDAGGIQGIALAATPYRYFSLDEIAGAAAVPGAAGPRRRILALDEIEDPRNLGAMARTAEAAGFRGLLVQEHRAAGATAVAVKSSAGALEHLRVARETNIADSLHRLKELGYWIVGLDAGPGSRSVYEVDFDMDLCLVIGAEGKGLRPRVRQACDLLVKLPMAGKVGSLNASAACAAAVYQVLRPGRAPAGGRMAPPFGASSRASSDEE